MFSLLETLIQDVRYGARALIRDARFTAVSVIALALGIGVNAAAFTAFRAFIERPLDARDPATMVNFSWTLPSGATRGAFSYPDYEAYRDRLHSFRGTIAVNLDRLRLKDAGGAMRQRDTEAGSLIGRLGLLRPSSDNSEVASTFIVSENFFSTLGVRAIRGRTFDSLALDEIAKSPPVLISENYWDRRFASDPALLGKTIRLNGAAFTIIGITPHDFAGTSIAVPDFWMPISLVHLVHPERNTLHDRDDGCCRIFGRLAPGVSMKQAEAEAASLAVYLRTLHEAHSDAAKAVTLQITEGSPLPGPLAPSLRLAISIIMLGVGMVLVIACANAASLQLARAAVRQQELATRLSLGAGTLRLVRQLLTESAIQGLLAGAIAVPVTWMLLRIALAKAAEAIPLGDGTLVLNVNPELQIFGYVLTISLISGILFGLAPAIESARTALYSSTRDAGSSRGRKRLRNTLVAAQVAVSLALMIAGAMLVRSAMQALRMDTGYRGDRVLDLSLQFPEEYKFTTHQKAALVKQLRDRISAMPGVAEITSARAPDDGDFRTAFISLNSEPPSSQNRVATLFYTWVQPNYFETLGIPLIAGSGFEHAGGSQHGVVVSSSTARRLWPNQNPIGRSLRLGTEKLHDKILPDGIQWQVIGVARDTRGITLDESDAQQIYLPLPAGHAEDYPLLIRTHSDPANLTQSLDSAVSAVDQPLVASLSTLQDMLRQTDTFLIDSICAAIATTISLFGLVLASMGIYSTVSYMVVLRTREIGIRMAIGAKRGDIVVMTMRDSLRSVIAGLMGGVVLAACISQLLHRILYGIGVLDPISFLGASFCFLAIAMVATFPPSRRAMRTDPMVALRYQ